eukprot:3604307-Prymnesium_polylepis.1
MAYTILLASRRELGILWSLLLRQSSMPRMSHMAFELLLITSQSMRRRRALVRFSDTLSEAS